MLVILQKICPSRLRGSLNLFQSYGEFRESTWFITPQSNTGSGSGAAGAVAAKCIMLQFWFGDYILCRRWCRCSLVGAYSCTLGTVWKDDNENFKARLQLQGKEEDEQLGRRFSVGNWNICKATSFLTCGSLWARKIRVVKLSVALGGCRCSRANEYDGNKEKSEDTPQRSKTEIVKLEKLCDTESILRNVLCCRVCSSSPPERHPFLVFRLVYYSVLGNCSTCRSVERTILG